jgi:hypothetical protein
LIEEATGGQSMTFASVKERPGTRARLGQSSGLQPGCERIAGDG